MGAQRNWQGPLTFKVEHNFNILNARVQRNVIFWQYQYLKLMC